jgi:hypothetical protein
MGSQMGSQSDLVSCIGGKLFEGLNALQNAGLTHRQWRRMSKEPIFLQAVMESIRELDVSMAGWPFTIEIPVGSNRDWIWENVRSQMPNEHLLRKDLVMQLKEWNQEQPISTPVCLEHRTQEVFLTPVLYRLHLPDGVQSELADRSLCSVSTEEAMVFFRDFTYRCWPSPSASAFVVGSTCHVEGDKREILTLGRTLDGTCQMSLWPHPSIPGGSYLLTKRIALTRK